jgi:ADP-heptose:LPS heptosyltransferase
LDRFLRLVGRHLEAFGYVIKVVVPLILRTRTRPVIFSRYTGMGDIICTFPAALELKKRHPGAVFIYNCHPDFVTLPKMAGIADHFTTLLEIGLVGHWYRFLLAGYYHFAHGDDHPDSSGRETMVREFGRQFGVPVNDAHPVLPVDPARVQKVKSLLAQKGAAAGPMILIHPGPSWPVKEWPRDAWTTLVRELRRQGFTNIVQLGVGRYMDFGRREVSPIPDVLSLVDQLTLEETIALVSLGRLFIGIDSGLLHIAASVRTPAVGIFGSTSPQLFYAPAYRSHFVASNVECAGCFHRTPRLHWLTDCPFSIKCMKSIGTNEVLQACLSKLQSTGE